MTSTDLAHVGDTAGRPGGGSAGLLAMIGDAARDPTLDATKMKTLTDLAMTLQDREVRAEFNRDLNAAIMEMPTITRAGIITINDRDGNFVRNQGRFARYEDIDRVVRPILRSHNLAIRFDVGESDKVTTVTPILTHANGWTERGGTMRLPLDESGSKNNVQGVGSSVSYGKRYTMCAMLNIVTEGTDDDGSLGKYEIGMPHERTVTVLEQAEAAAMNGTYADWFPRQSPKDRAWLVETGHNTRLGGGLALPGTERDSGSPKGGSGPAQGRRAPDAGKPQRTARQWTEDYERSCRDAGTLDELMAVQADAAADIDRLKTASPALYDRAIKAGSDAVARLSGGDA